MGLKAYGSYSYRINNPLEFFVNVLAGQHDYTTEDFRAVMSNRILHPLSDFLAESKFSYNDMDANRQEVAEGMRQTLDQEFDRFGFTITDFRIEGTSFDEDTLERINRVAGVTAESMAAKAAGLNYAQLQQMEALREAARNEGGTAGAGIGIGAGISLGQTMMNTFQPDPQGATPPEPNAASGSLTLEERLARLQRLRDANLISEDEFSAKRAEILSEL